MIRCHTVAWDQPEMVDTPAEQALRGKLKQPRREPRNPNPIRNRDHSTCRMIIRRNSAD